MSAEEFADFMTKSTTPYQYIEYARPLLLNRGYVELFESDLPDEIPNRFFIVRDGRSLIAVDIGGFKSAVVFAAHNDSPQLKLKPIFDSSAADLCTARVVNYAGGLANTWYGRDLKAAGAVIVKDENGNLKRVNFSSNKAIGTIPMPYDFSKGLQFSADRENGMNPILGLRGSELLPFIAKTIGYPVDSILSHDISLVDARPATIINENIITSPRLDDLSSAYSCLKGFIESEAKDTVNILAIFDSEEIGSRTRTGALSDQLGTVWELLSTKTDILSLKARSLIVSCDTAHLQHPNYDGMGEVKHQLRPGGGIVIKTSYKSNYAFDVGGNALLTEAAIRGQIKYQVLGTKNGPRGGGTIGPKMEMLEGVTTVDTGVACLAMHSCREMMDVEDIDEHVKLVKYVFNNFEELRLYAMANL
ncbi:Clan MH, family M18, aspartyl aminopeptidase-like metallopeptidase [Tritrichomonas foetus]|uniref:aspartyl aminopeptidase n=1 Tax=Tritrichomonas foetus TaxID=1144522 RepID=A0A1J4JU33_9EUKA|nr:Clan MH, family M18, aspartyl aminopeptidase-like metallopeptidase [Tritrichomonas foetus]|eukprot:OHT01030.1 Clan MH, family M18, aspartyl aminopeptidase-like metallopeptidase [Tritrichomonas foetus]